MVRRFIQDAVCLSVIVSAVLAASPSTVRADDIPTLPAEIVSGKVNPLSDIVTGGLSIADRKLYRQAFAELARERSYYDFGTERQRAAVYPSHTVWFNPMARGGEFLSLFPGNDYDLESYGFQGGTTFVSSPDKAVGVMIGYERGYFRNDVDSIRFDDYYLGLYFGRRFDNDLDFRGFVGFGHQRFKLHRDDGMQEHGATYEGASFALNLDFGTWIEARRGIMIRPFIALDVEYAQQESAFEEEVGTLFRYYDRSTSSQLFFRLGADLEKRWQRFDLHGGLSYTCMAIGKTRASAGVFFPEYDWGVMFPGPRTGRSSWNLKAGMNWHLNPARTNTIFVDYIADIYTDQRKATGVHTGMVGFSVRF